jgi:hypothetical protein
VLTVSRASVDWVSWFRFPDTWAGEQKRKGWYSFGLGCRAGSRWIDWTGVMMEMPGGTWVLSARVMPLGSSI